jgi:acyl dehydratase
MGGGVRLVCHEPVTVGMRVYLSSTLRSVDVRASTSGELAVLIYHNKYETAEGRLLQSCIRTMLLR